jgi:hypothetical protein
MACPRKSAQTRPVAETAKPRAAITAPKATVDLTPIRSATQPMTMPPIPVPTQTNAPANATTDRSVPREAVIGLSPTTTSRGAP